MNILLNKMHKQIKQNPQTNQMKPKQIKSNPNKPTAKRTHTTQPRERSQEEKRVWEREKKRFLPMMANREVRDGGDGNRFSKWRWRQWEAVVAAWCWEWGFVWESREESDRSELGGESELGRFFNLGFFCYWEVLLTYWGFWLFFFIYTKPRVAFYKTQLRMNWSCVLLNAAL